MPIDPIGAAVDQLALQQIYKFIPGGQNSLEKGPAAKNAARQEELDKLEQTEREENQDPEVEPDEPPPKVKFAPQGSLA